MDIAETVAAVCGVEILHAIGAEIGEGCPMIAMGSTRRGTTVGEYTSDDEAGTCAIRRFSLFLLIDYSRP